MARDGGHLERSTRRQRQRLAPLTFTENSAAAAQLPPQESGRRERGRERGTENKKGGGKRGRKESGTGLKQLRRVAAAATTRYSPPPQSANSLLALRRCLKPDLSLLGQPNPPEPPEWLLRHPISGLAFVYRQSAQGDGEEPQGQARLRCSPAKVRKAIFAKALRPSQWRKGNWGQSRCGSLA